MSTPARLAGFAAVLAAAFGGAVAAGAAIGPDGGATADEPAGHAAMTAAPHPVRGLAAAEGGLAVAVADPDLRQGRAERVRFAIEDAAGATVRDFDVEHTKRMHLIVVRRDLIGFQHLHPEQQADGSWEAPIRLPDAGSYRLFADFTRAGEPHTLATDLRVDGGADLEPLPPARPAERSDGGYDVRLAGGPVRAGEEAELRFAITRDGTPVHTEPYLGAGGHLVALREGDLAFLHVHPTEQGEGDEVGFGATFPTAGRYRLFLQFQHEGRVHTVAFTQEVRR